MTDDRISMRDYVDQRLTALDLRLSDLIAARDREAELMQRALTTARTSDDAAVRQAAEWTRERLMSHNELLKKWTELSAQDRSNYATRESLDALRDAFAANKDVTAKALLLAEGKASGRNDMWGYLIGAATLGAAIASIIAFVAARIH